jgi:hypothetical protein
MTRVREVMRLANASTIPDAPSPISAYRMTTPKRRARSASGNRSPGCSSNVVITSSPGLQVIPISAVLSPSVALWVRAISSPLAPKIAAAIAAKRRLRSRFSR